jgi:hypothetical protein
MGNSGFCGRQEGDHPVGRMLRRRQEFNWSLTGVWMAPPVSIYMKDESSASELSARKICATGGAIFEDHT